jgi:hypothetical protein
MAYRVTQLHIYTVIQILQECCHLSEVQDYEWQQATNFSYLDILIEAITSCAALAERKAQ